MNNHYNRSALKTSLIHFLFGKAFNAVISFCTIILLVRWIDAQDYGVYVAFLALQASSLAISSMGIDTTAERFLPEFRTRYSDKELLGFVVSSFLLRSLSLVLLMIVGTLIASPLAKLIGLYLHIDALNIWIFVIGLTGLFTFTLALLESMLHQRQAQISMTCYLASKFLLIVLAYKYTKLDLNLLVKIEIVSTAFAGLIALCLLFKKFSLAGLSSGWGILKNNSSRLGRFAFFNYLAQVVFQFFNAEVMKLLVVKLLGVMQSARYGFVFNLVETIQRYLPAVLMLRLIKPVFVSRYTKSGNFSELNEMASIALKLNLLMLMPMIVLAMVYGYDFLRILSSGKYEDAHLIFVGALILLIPASHQLVLSLLASTVEKNVMQFYSGLVSVVAFPCALFLIPTFGPLGAVAASAVSSLVYNIFATLYLRHVGFDYRPDIRALSVFLLAGLVMYSLAILTNTFFSLWWCNFIFSVIACCSGYLLTVRLLSAFSEQERALMNSILPKPLFFF